MWRWYGTDVAEADQVLTIPAATPAALARKGEIYRQVLSLLLAGRRPAYYLIVDHQALAGLTDRYLHLLTDAGVIDPALRDAALAARLRFRDDVPPPAAEIYAGNKATDQLRDDLVTLLHLPNYYALDRLDLSGWSSIDEAAQHRISDVLSRLGDPGYDRSLGLYGRQLLGSASPARLAWSFVLYERGTDSNFVRVRADSLNEPFDINSGAKLQLGSTAKLRTLITYLDIVDALHRRFAALPRARLLAIEAAATDDPITGWAAGWLADAKDRSLQTMLDAAMQRTYSASPRDILHRRRHAELRQFREMGEPRDPDRRLGLRQLDQQRLHPADARHRRLRDRPGWDPDERVVARPRRSGARGLSARFADQEGREYLDRFWRDYRGRTPQEALDLLATRTRPDPRRLAVVFRSVRPDASRSALGAFLAQHLPQAAIGDDELWDLYRDSSPRRVSLRDRGYIAGVHPLELWLVGYLQDHPERDARRGDRGQRRGAAAGLHLALRQPQPVSAEFAHPHPARRGCV